MNRPLSGRLFLVAATGLVCVLALPHSARAGRIVNVPADATLQNAIRNALAGDEIVVAAGTYYPTLFLSITANGVTVRGATGNPADVVIQGAGMNVSPPSGNTEGLVLSSDNVTIKDLTVQEFFYHAIHFQGGADNITITNVITRNNGQQHIKGAKYNTGGLIEKTVCEQTYVRTNITPTDPRGVDYVGGIDLHGGINYIIRDCVVRNIMGAGGDADGALFAWDLCSNITIERCVVIGCNRGICFGNNSGGSSGYDVDGGIARNNFVYARTAAPSDPDHPWTGNADVAIDVFASRNVNLFNNTVWTDSGSYGRTVRVGKGTTYSNSNVQFKYNIIRGNFQVFTGSNYTSTGDITGNTPQLGWFVNPLGENLHLTRSAAAAIDHAVTLPEVATDFDNRPRPSRSVPDVGADEYFWGDINADGKVGVGDLNLMARSWNKTQGNPGYDARCDLTGDNSVNTADVNVVAGDWGR